MILLHEHLSGSWLPLRNALLWLLGAFLGECTVAMASESGWPELMCTHRECSLASIFHFFLGCAADVHKDYQASSSKGL